MSNPLRLSTTSEFLENLKQRFSLRYALLIILLSVIIIILNASVQLFTDWLGDKLKLNNFIYNLLPNISAIVCVFLLCYIVSKLFKFNFFESVSFLGFKKINYKIILLAVVIGIPYVIGYTITCLIYYANGSAIDLNPNWINLLIIFVFLSSVFEEIFYRGFIFQIMRFKYSFIKAALISNFFWAIPHLVQLHAGAKLNEVIGNIIIALIFGFVYCYLFEKAGNAIWGASVFHLIMNSAAIIDIDSKGMFFIPTGIASVSMYAGLFLCFILAFPIINLLTRKDNSD